MIMAFMMPYHQTNIYIFISLYVGVMLLAEGISDWDWAWDCDLDLDD